MSKHSKQDDPLDEFREWQDHQFVPGYYLGGRVPPFLKGKVPNRFGYALLGTGILSIVGTVATLLSPRYQQTGVDWYFLFFGISIGVLQLIAGVKLLQKPERIEQPNHLKKRPRKKRHGHKYHKT